MDTDDLSTAAACCHHCTATEKEEAQEKEGKIVFGKAMDRREREVWSLPFSPA